MLDFHTAEIHEGQTVYLEPLERKRIEGYTTVQKGTVVLVGFKYITVKVNNWAYKFDIKTYKQIVEDGYKKDWLIFFSERDYREYKYWNDCYDFISSFFKNRKNCKLTNEQMKNICEVITKGRLR